MTTSICLMDLVALIPTMETSKSVKDIAEFFKKLPSVGSKSAYRMAYAALSLPKSDLIAFEEVLNQAIQKIHRCLKCGLLIDDEECPICDDMTRDRKTVLVVTDSKDVYSIESTDAYHGLYFVLRGSLSPANHRTPSSIGLDALMKKVKEEGIQEVIAVTNKDLEGETTALYIANLLKNSSCKVTKPAQGLPSGAIIEYADPLTMSEAIKGRVLVGKENE